MKPYYPYALFALLLSMLLAIDFFQGPRVCLLAAGFSLLWFVIALVLLSRPPGIPEFVSEKPGSDEQYVVRRDVNLQTTLKERIGLALSVACGCCLLLWLSLGILAL